MHTTHTTVTHPQQQHSYTQATGLTLYMRADSGGFVGVQQAPNSGKFMAKLRHKSLGIFPTKRAAAIAYSRALQESECTPSQKILCGKASCDICVPRSLAACPRAMSLYAGSSPPHTIMADTGRELVLCRCTEGHEWRARPYFLIRRGDGCPKCASTEAERTVHAWLHAAGAGEAL